MQRADVRADQEELRIADDDIAFLDLGAVGADGLHLPALEYDARLVALFDEVIEKGFLVVGDGHALECVVSASG